MKDKIRGYDSSQLFREDAILRLQWLAAEIKESLLKIKKLEREVEKENDPDCK